MEHAADLLYYPAMAELPDTPYQPTRSLLTGHFHEQSGYRAIRRQGSGDWLLILTLDGQGRFGHAGGELLTSPGDWVLLRPGTPHDYGVEPQLQRWELLWAHFQPRADWFAWLGWPEAAKGLMRLRIAGDARQELTAQFLRVHELLGSQRRHAEALALNALEALLLGCDAQQDQQAAPNQDPRIARALDYLELHMAEKILIEDVAAAVGLSASRLAHLFRQHTGQSIQQHLELRRMQVAAELLRRTGFPIQQVAATTGFDSPFYFSRRFAQWAGLSPLAFRQRNQSG